MNIGFFVRHFTERGTEVAIYDYAKYNEDILKNKSYIICFTENSSMQQSIGPTERCSYEKFNTRFPIIQIHHISEMSIVIKTYKLSFFYTLTSGGKDIYEFNNKMIWGNCKTIKHCVFDTTFPESDFYISIANVLNTKYNTQYPVIPHIVDLPIVNENLRHELSIPEHATVFGRYGGYSEFNIKEVHTAIKEYIDTDENCYFLFMNTEPFHHHPRIIYLEKTVDVSYKTKFIHTCDAMIHARLMGETFGLSVAEFSFKNKPIITSMCGDLEHIHILKENAIIYHSIADLLYIFKHIQPIIQSKDNWNSYTNYTPEYVMQLFKTYIFDKA